MAPAYCVRRLPRPAALIHSVWVGPFDHFLLTRFSAVLAPGAAPASEEWLRYRLAFFVDAAHPSVAGQRGAVPFQWLVLFDDRCPDTFRADVDAPRRSAATPPAAAQTTAPAATATPPATEAPAEAPAEAEVAVAPLIASIGVLDPQGDGEENPDLTPRALDGDPTTYWRSRSYVNPAYGMKEGIGLDIVLAERATVSEIELTLLGTGGRVQVKTDAADPVNGAVLAEADMGPTTIITLPEPVATDRVVLWFTALPVADSDGKNRVELAEVTVR